MKKRKIPKYADRTRVSIPASMAEIEREVRKYGGGDFSTMQTERLAAVAFSFRGVNAKFAVPVPTEGTPKERAAEARRRWRVMLLSIKSKLVAVHNEVVTAEVEFLPEPPVGER